MSTSTILLGLVVIILAFYMVEKFYLKKHLNIQKKPKGLLSKGRNKTFITIEVLLIISFALSYVFFFRENLQELNVFSHIHLFVYFCLLYFFRGLEEWVTKKGEKGYYHDWLGSVSFILMFLFIWFGESVL